ncbi:MAG: hypothetical protein ABW061_03110 [Polyangiaceae bacterium]
MYTLRRVFAFLAAVGFVLGIVGHGQAQVAPTVTLPTTGVAHTRQNRGNNLLNTQINYDDCHLDDAIRFSLSLTGGSTYQLETWAGSGCDVLTSRTIANTQCWRLLDPFSPQGNNPPPIEISIKKILSGRTGANGSSGTAGASSTAGGGGADSIAGSAGDNTTASGGASAGSAAVTPDGDAACTADSAVTSPQAITVYFMLVDSSSNIQGTFATFKATYKLFAPAPPDTLNVGIGENILPLSWSYSTSNSDTTINGYRFYCDPPPGAAAAADAGVLPDDGGTLLIPACTGSTELIPGQRPDEKYRCGDVGGKATKGQASGLINGVAYNVAISTTDSYGNSGVLSVVECQVPQPVTGFFEAYRDAGGEGGGGFCSFSRRREPLPLILLLGFASYWVMRRRRAT